MSAPRPTGPDALRTGEPFGTPAPHGRHDEPSPDTAGHPVDASSRPAGPSPDDPPDLLYSDDENELRSAVRRLLDDHCPPDRVLARTESDSPHDRALFQRLAGEMGLAGLLVPERLGGQGATHREAAVVLEELGRSLAPVPFLTSSVMATEALLGCLPEHAGTVPGRATGGERPPGGAGSGAAAGAAAVPGRSLEPASASGHDPGRAAASGHGLERGAASGHGLGRGAVKASGHGSGRGAGDGAGADGEPVPELLARLASGRGVAVVALPLSTGPDGCTGAWPVAGARGVRHEGGALHGRITAVADATAADVLLVVAGTGLYAVDVRQDGVTVAARTALDRTRPLADVTLTGAHARTLTSHAQEPLRRALAAGAGLLASEQLGVAEWCLAETVRHTRDRYQFNRPVGSFQALKHRLADVWLDLVHLRAAARNAADALATGSPDTALAVALAQSCACDAAVHAADEALQLHGGIGMTWEHPVHLYLKRAKADSIALGTAARHRGQLARLADLAPPQDPPEP